MQLIAFHCDSLMLKSVSAGRKSADLVERKELWGVGGEAPPAPWGSPRANGEAEGTEPVDRDQAPAGRARGRVRGKETTVWM